ncbi:MAG: hypothetical protein HQ543_09400 [Bacteroidetes bacterium]|nr:hypothetical protein [Bacteroidota bacterium]
MRNILTQKEPPFIFMILIASFSWAISHVVTRTIEKPIIEIQSRIVSNIPKDIILCQNDKLDGKKNLKLTQFLLTNISKDQLFEKLSFLITPKDGKIYGVRIRARSPAVSGDTPETCSSKYGLFANVTLHPGWQFEIDIVTDRNTNLDVRLNSAPKAVNITESNIETWLVRNESSVLILFIIIISITAIVCLAYIAQGQRKEKPQKPDKLDKEEVQ